ncbi:MAG: hypothetical protein ACTSP4_06695, partial [Candidatus Hodarchaeales archaeon]
MKVRTNLLMIFISAAILLQVIIGCNAQSTEIIGYYEVTMYIDGAFTGRTTISRHSISESITTYFGTYSGVTRTSRSDTKLSHSSNGYVKIINWNTYTDQQHNIIKSESTWTVRISGYQQVTFTSVYEYGNYTVLQNTDTLYEETYTRRYYDNGVLDKIVECRDV